MFSATKRPAVGFLFSRLRAIFFMTYTKFSRYATAHTAQSRADSGEFCCMGRVLKPFSLFHAELLGEALGDDFAYLDDLADFALLEVATKICSEEKPSLDLGIPETELELQEFKAKCDALDVEKESVKFGEYFSACFLSKPRLRERGGDSEGKSKELNAPYPHIVISQILSRANFCATFDELFYKWPVAKVLWLYWSLRELSDDFSYIADSDEPKEKTQEDIEREQKQIALISAAIERRNKKAIGIVAPEVLKQIDDETAAIIAKIEIGELEELPE